MTTVAHDDSMIPKPQQARVPSRLLASPIPHSSSLPPASFRDLQTTPSRPTRPSQRRHSNRIHSPSDSSGSEEEDNSPRTERKIFVRTHSQPFPTSGMPVPVSHHPLPPKRTKTLSDPSRLDSPLAMRFEKGVGPPSAFGGVGGFLRPSPAGRRRRGSAGSAAAVEDMVKSPECGPSRPFARNTSSSSAGLASPSWNATFHRQPTSLISPTHGLDHTSFHIPVKSPEEVDDQVHPMGSSDRDDTDADIEEDFMEVDIVGDLDKNGLLDPRLSRISVSSLTS